MSGREYEREDESEDERESEGEYEDESESEGEYEDESESEGEYEDKKICVVQPDNRALARPKQNESGIQPPDMNELIVPEEYLGFPPGSSVDKFYQEAVTRWEDLKNFKNGKFRKVMKSIEKGKSPGSDSAEWKYLIGKKWVKEILRSLIAYGKTKTKTENITHLDYTLPTAQLDPVFLGFDFTTRTKEAADSVIAHIRAGKVDKKKDKIYTRKIKLLKGILLQKFDEFFMKEGYPSLLKYNRIPRSEFSRKGKRKIEPDEEVSQEIQEIKFPKKKVKKIEELRATVAGIGENPDVRIKTATSSDMDIGKESPLSQYHNWPYSDNSQSQNLLGIPTVVENSQYDPFKVPTYDDSQSNLPKLSEVADLANKNKEDVGIEDGDLNVEDYLEKSQPPEVVPVGIARVNELDNTGPPVSLPNVDSEMEKEKKQSEVNSTLPAGNELSIDEIVGQFNSIIESNDLKTLEDGKKSMESWVGYFTGKVHTMEISEQNDMIENENSQPVDSLALKTARLEKTRLASVAARLIKRINEINKRKIEEQKIEEQKIKEQKIEEQKIKEQEYKKQLEAFVNSAKDMPVLSDPPKFKSAFEAFRAFLLDKK